jgi:hypothetical protein
MMGVVTSDEHDATLAALKKPATSDARMSNQAMTEINMMKTLMKRSLGREVKSVNGLRVDDLELGVHVGYLALTCKRLQNGTGGEQGTKRI